MSRTSLVRRAVAFLVLALLIVPVMMIGSPQGATAADTDGAETKSGSGRFSKLDVTVSQVTHLRNQVVRVSWKGGKQSSTSGRNFYNNYLQIMQCWGDENAPKREKCQYGGIFDDQRGGQATSSRVIVNNGDGSNPEDLKDPAETYTAVFPKTAQVPFESVTGKTVTGARNEFFDSQSTNEIDYGRTSADGTGEEFFELQTGAEAPGLGCGLARPADGSARDCWLVVVPRDDTEVNGVGVSTLPNNRLETSPLAASNFANAISFRLDFDPVGVTCKVGAAERRVLGNETAAEAITQWQPELCDHTGAIFGYSQIADGSARQQTLTSTPWLSLVNRPLGTDMNSDGRLLTYAPVAVSAIGIGMVIERIPSSNAPASVQTQRGTRVLNLNLNARLVAKLLTQSYTASVTGDLKHVGGNPRWLTEDKEFLDLNEEFKNLQYTGSLYSITNPLGLSDANQSLWEWVKSDPEARAFIAGTPAVVDGQTVKVNPFYKGMDLDRTDFPRSDSTCVKYPESAAQADFCALDHLAYAADFHAATRGAIRGLTLANDLWDVNPPQRYKQAPGQIPGERAVLIVTDTATAARFKVAMAKLKNAAGDFVAPDEDGMSAALGGMKEGATKGVLDPNPAMKVAGAYPLTEVTYAMTAPRQLEKDEAVDYAGLLQYVTSDAGQTTGIAPGQLPEGYLPLPAKLRAQAQAVAGVVAKQGGPLPATPSATPTSDPTNAGGGGSTGGTGSTGGDGTSTGDVPVANGPIEGNAPPVVQAPPGNDTVLASAPTKAVSTPATRFVLLIALILGLVAVAARPAVLGYGLLQQRLTERAVPPTP